jgi:ankyrin repeat protein
MHPIANYNAPSPSFSPISATSLSDENQLDAEVDAPKNPGEVIARDIGERLYKFWNSLSFGPQLAQAAELEATQPSQQLANIQRNNLAKYEEYVKALVRHNKNPKDLKNKQKLDDLNKDKDVQLTLDFFKAFDQKPHLRDFRKLEELISQGVNPNTPVTVEGKTATPPIINIAIKDGIFELVEILIRHGADVRDAADGYEMPITAILKSKSFTKAQRLTLFKTMLDHMNEPMDDFNFAVMHNTKPTSILSTVCGIGDPDLVKALLDAGANPAIPFPGNRLDDNPFIQVILTDGISNKNRAIITQHLIDAGWDSNAVLENADSLLGPEGAIKITPLQLACRFGSLEAVKTLLTKTTPDDVNKADMLGKDALIYTTSSIDRGPNEDSRRYQIAELLIEHGANVTAKTRKGLTAADMAKGIRRFAIEKLLTETVNPEKDSTTSKLFWGVAAGLGAAATAAAAYLFGKKAPPTPTFQEIAIRGERERLAQITAANRAAEAAAEAKLAAEAIEKQEIITRVSSKTSELEKSKTKLREKIINAENLKRVQEIYLGLRDLRKAVLELAKITEEKGWGKRVLDNADSVRGKFKDIKGKYDALYKDHKTSLAVDLQSFLDQPVEEIVSPKDSITGIGSLAIIKLTCFPIENNNFFIGKTSEAFENKAENLLPNLSSSLEQLRDDEKIAQQINLQKLAKEKLENLRKFDNFCARINNAEESSLESSSSNSQTNSQLSPPTSSSLIQFPESSEEMKSSTFAEQELSSSSSPSLLSSPPSSSSPAKPSRSSPQGTLSPSPITATKKKVLAELMKVFQQFYEKTSAELPPIYQRDKVIDGVAVINDAMEDVISRSSLNEKFKAELRTNFTIEKIHKQPTVRAQLTAKLHEKIDEMIGDKSSKVLPFLEKDHKPKLDYIPFGIVKLDYKSINGFGEGLSHGGDQGGEDLQASIAMIEFLEKFKLYKADLLADFVADADLADISLTGDGFQTYQRRFRSALQGVTFLDEDVVKSPAPAASPIPVAPARFEDQTPKIIDALCNYAERLCDDSQIPNLSSSLPDIMDASFGPEALSLLEVYSGITIDDGTNREKAELMFNGIIAPDDTATTEIQHLLRSMIDKVRHPALRLRNSEPETEEKLRNVFKTLEKINSPSPLPSPSTSSSLASSSTAISLP